jgi:putative tryptophan/tyrosine transport system substrate-binding protein
MPAAWSTLIPQVHSVLRTGSRRPASFRGLLAYGPNLLDMYRQSGMMIGKVLQESKPADLPSEAPTQFQLVVNLRTARTLA